MSLTNVIYVKPLKSEDLVVYAFFFCINSNKIVSFVNLEMMNESIIEFSIAYTLKENNILCKLGNNARAGFA